VLESFAVTVDLYRRTFARGAVLAAKNWPVLGSAFAYAAILAVGGYFALFLGLAGGFALSLLTSACLGSALYLVEMIVRTNKVTWTDFRQSFTVYLWDVVGITFTLWLFWQVVTPLLHQMPQGHVIVLCLDLLIVVLFNAVPELIYLGHYGILALFSRSYQFIANNWIEWFPPNLALIGGLVIVWSTGPSGGLLGTVVRTAATALFLYFAMVVRGLLFIELDGTNRRARIFRHRMGR
jgi:hypothetical protein